MIFRGVFFEGAIKIRETVCRERHSMDSEREPIIKIAAIDLLEPVNIQRKSAAGAEGRLADWMGGWKDE